MKGFLITDKPLGMSSSNMVVFVRHRLPRGTNVGHGGTLDPEASGVLPVCVGAATRLFDYIIDKQKVYVARLKLGVVTDTQDASGKILETRDVNVSQAELEAVLPRFTGDIMQIPPMYSALKRNGERLYKLARKGETVEIEPRACRIDAIELIGPAGEDAYDIRVSCGKGVYIRTLCHDIGAALGCGAHMASLRRVRAGVFSEEDALTRDEIETLAKEGRLAEKLLPLDAPLMHLPAVHVGEEARHAVRNGNALKPAWMSEPAPQAEAVRIYLCGRFAGIGAPQTDGSVRFRAMLLTEED